jgi:hypothetical protein
VVKKLKSGEEEEVNIDALMDSLRKEITSIY